MYLLLSQTKRWHTITCSKLKIKHPDDVIHLVLLPIIPFCLTLWAPTPQNGQTHSNNSSATTDELSECVQPFRRVALKVLTLSMFLQQNNTYRSYDLNHYLFPMFSFDSTPSLSLGVWFSQEWNGRRQKETLGKYNFNIVLIKVKNWKNFWSI